MKKLYISCPMKGRTEENIRKSMEKMHKIAEIVFDQELEVLPTYTEHKPPENAKASIWYLGRSIQVMADADYFIGINEYSEFFKGCETEKSIAMGYGIDCAFVNMRKLMPDAIEAERESWKNQDKHEIKARPMI